MSSVLLGAQYYENYKRSEPLSPFLSIMKIMGILAPARPAAPHPLTPAHVSGQNFDPFAFQKPRLGHM